MARGRMISTSIATDKRLNSLSVHAELLYLKTVPHLDRDGLILGDPLLLWGKVCPRRPELMGEVADIINEWIESELVIAYESEDGTVLYFTGFHKNQIGMRYDREAASTLPTPPGYVRGNDGLTPAELRQESGTTPPETNRNRKETNTDDGDWRAVVDAYQGDIGVITSTVSDEMKAFYDEMGPKLLIEAIKEAARNNVRKWSYIAGILQRWKANGRTSGKKPKPQPTTKYVSTDPVTGQRIEVVR